MAKISADSFGSEIKLQDFEPSGLFLRPREETTQEIQSRVKRKELAQTAKLAEQKVQEAHRRALDITKLSRKYSLEWVGIFFFLSVTLLCLVTYIFESDSASECALSVLKVIMGTAIGFGLRSMMSP